MKAKLFFVLLLLGLTSSAAFAPDAAPVQAISPRPTVGAIRWDGWYSNPPNPNEHYLAPAQWQNRLPFFGQVVDATHVTVREDSQAVIDQEIVLAHAAGINYWAFDYYADADLKSDSIFGDPEYGLELYLSSALKDQINFALMLLGGPALGAKEDW